MGTETQEVAEKQLDLTLHCHHQNEFCIKIGSDESQFNA